MEQVVQTGEYITSLLAAVLNDTVPQEKPKDLLWEDIYTVSVNHNVSNMLCYAVEKLDNKPDKILMKHFCEDRDIGIVREMNQTYETDTILNIFEEQHIKCLPLKGYITKNLYPSPDMRMMSDTDILIEEKDKDTLNEIMLANGYEFKVESAHEYVYLKKPYVSIELHKSLVPDYNKRLYMYYGNGWKVARAHAGSEYVCEMADEDFYIYMLVHFAKHYIQAGIGIRHVMDIYVYLHQYTLDEAYIEKELKKLDLFEFDKNVRMLSNVWFGDVEHNDKTAQMAEFIFDSGSYGNHEHRKNYILMKDAEGTSFKQGKQHNIIQMVFLPIEKMKRKYTILEKAPFLYPFVLCYRWAEVLLTRRKNLKRLTEVTNTPVDEIEEYFNHCYKMGIHNVL